MRAKRKLTQPPPEFGFAAECFNLVPESTEDGARVTRERQDQMAAKAQSESRQDELLRDPAFREQAMKIFQRSREEWFFHHAGPLAANLPQRTSRRMWTEAVQVTAALKL